MKKQIKTQTSVALGTCQLILYFIYKQFKASRICLIVTLRPIRFIPELLKHLGTLSLGWHYFGHAPSEAWSL